MGVQFFTVLLHFDVGSLLDSQVRCLDEGFVSAYLIGGRHLLHNVWLNE